VPRALYLSVPFILSLSFSHSPANERKLSAAAYLIFRPPMPPICYVIMCNQRSSFQSFQHLGLHQPTLLDDDAAMSLAAGGDSCFEHIVALN
jgi:hypothetical protein